MSITPEWPELEAQFGQANVTAIDLAISACLANYPAGIKREEFYLVSEGLTYAVLTTLRDNGVRLAPVVTPLRPEAVS